MTTCNERRLVILDTETTGLPRYAGFARHYPPHAQEMYDGARLIEMAAVMFDGNGKELSREQIIVRPEGPFYIDPAALLIHGITHERVVKEGCHTYAALERLYCMLKMSGSVDGCTIVGHNISFDWHIIVAEAYRVCHWPLVHTMYTTPTFCTMLSNTKRCGLLRWNGERKWPKLSELYSYMFPDEELSAAHTAMGDVLGTARCFFESLRLNSQRKNTKLKILARG
jgi:DNA polymerase III epsilon subunit-like protein